MSSQDGESTTSNKGSSISNQTNDGIFENELYTIDLDMENIYDSFIDDYLLDYDQVGAYRSTTNWVIRITPFAFFLTLISALYISGDNKVITEESILLYGLTIVSVGAFVILFIDKWQSEYQTKDIVYHDIASVIDAWRKGDLEVVQTKLQHLRNSGIKGDKRLIPQIWEEELDHFIEEFDTSSQKEINFLMNSGYKNFVFDMGRLDRVSIDMEEIYDEPELLEPDRNILRLVIESFNKITIQSSMMMLIYIVFVAVIGITTGYMWGIAWGGLISSILLWGIHVIGASTN